jgi:hypothetical protein
MDCYELGFRVVDSESSGSGSSNFMRYLVVILGQ